MTTTMGSAAASGPASGFDGEADREFEHSRASAEHTLLQLVQKEGAIPLGDGRLDVSSNPRANARAIVRLVSSGRLSLTFDQRLVPGSS